MALVTVCVPAYRSARFIGQTLASIKGQVLTDFEVLIAVEPPSAAETVDACRPFGEDRRFRVYVNESTLGYAGNVASLIRRVRSPYFAILPHDDLWHPRYLAALVDRLADYPDASVAFADIYRFGAVSGIRTYDLPDGDPAAKLLAFFLAGADGVAWHGLTRTDAVEIDFPDNEFDGFAVECEWALHLLLQGTAVRQAEPLYLKREPARDNVQSVATGWGVRMPEDVLRRALAHHRQRLLEPLESARLTAIERTLVSLAAESAALLRWVAFSDGRFDFLPDDQARIDTILAGCASIASPEGRAIAGRVELALSRYHAQRGRGSEAEQFARAAFAHAPDYGEAAINLARVLLQQGLTLEALPIVQRAATLAPMAIGLASVEAECALRVAELFALR
jgi:hypothetical protein